MSNNNYLFETISQSNFDLLVSEFQLGSSEINVWILKKNVSNIISGTLKYKKLDKNQFPGFRNKYNFDMYWNENTQELIVPLEHNDISDSLQTSLPLFGVFKYKKGKFEMTKSFGFIPKAQMSFKDAQLFNMQMDYLSKKIVLFYIDGAMQVFDAETYQELMYFPGLKRKIIFNGVHQFYIPEKDLYFFRYHINDVSPDGKNLIPKAYVLVVKNTKNPVKVYDGEELFYRDNEMPIRLSHRANNEYYNILDYDGGDTLKVVLYHLK